MPTSMRMKATLGSVITLRNREIHPGSIASRPASLVASRRVSPPATSTVRPSILPEQVGLVACDEVDDVRLQRGIGGQAGGLPHRFLRPIGIAAAHLGKTADQGDGVVRRLRRHGILRLRLLVAAVLLVLIALVGVASGRPGSGPPICTGVAAPRLVPGAMAAICVA